METYCVSYKKNTANKNSSVRRTKQNRLMLVSIVLIVVRKNQVSLKTKNQGLLSRLGIDMVSLK